MSNYAKTDFKKKFEVLERKKEKMTLVSKKKQELFLQQVEERYKDIASTDFWIGFAKKYAIPVLHEILEDEEAPYDARLRAMTEVLNRALGKPRERHEVAGAFTVTWATEEPAITVEPTKPSAE